MTEQQGKPEETDISTLTLAPPPPRKYWSGWQTVGLGVAIFAVYFAVQTLLAIGFVIFKILSDASLLTEPDLAVKAINELAYNGLLISLATVTSGLAGLGMTLLFIKLRRNVTIAEYLSLRAIKARTVFILLGTTVVLLLVLESGGIFFNQGNSDVNTQFMVETYRTSVWPPLFWIAVVVFAPVFEETFFRGFLFAGWSRSLGAGWTIVLTALLFAVLHLQYDFFGMGIVFILGLVLGFVRYRTGSLWGSITIHSFWNLLQMVGTVLVVNGVIK